MSKKEKNNWLNCFYKDINFGGSKSSNFDLSKFLPNKFKWSSAWFVCAQCFMISINIWGWWNCSSQKSFWYHNSNCVSKKEKVFKTTIGCKLCHQRTEVKTPQATGNLLWVLENIWIHSTRHQSSISTTVTAMS